MLQGVALFLYLLFDGLTPLYVISALFGLFQGGIVPMYAIIVREYFPPEAGRHPRRPGDHVDHPGHGARRLDVGRDLRPTGSYWQAFANGLAWNVLNGTIVLLLLRRRRRMRLAVA